VGSFRAVRGSPEVCNLYELRDLDAFGDDYVRVRASDTESIRLQRNSFNGTLAVYEQVVTANVEPEETSLPGWRHSITAPVLSTLLFSAATDAEVISYYEVELASSIDKHGALSGRLGCQVDAGRAKPEPRRWSTFLEWANLADALSWADSGVAEEHSRAFGAPQIPTLLHVMRRDFTRANPSVAALTQ
jgi:hypothetical protein